MISVVRLVFSMVGEVCRVIEKDLERHDRLYGGLQFIRLEMEMVNALIKEEHPGTVQEIRIQQLQEFAYDVEDFVEGLWEPGAYGKVLVAIGMDPRAQQVRSIDRFKQRIISLTKEWKPSGESSQGGDTDHGAMSAPYGDEQEDELPLQGMDVPKSRIFELLSPTPAEGQQLRVVSVVGRRGVGKTSLARAIYKDPAVSHAFDCVAWVDASGCNSKKALLPKIFESVRAALSSRPETENVPKEAEGAFTNLQDILSDKRYLVFIDDVQQAQLWKDTVHAFPDNGKNSRIIVTTSVHSVSAACSSGSYVYSMECLSDDDSESLFWRKVFGYQRIPPHSLRIDSESIFSKCGGLPLALTSVAKHLNIKGKKLDSSHCKDVGQNLGRDYLSGNSIFKGMRRALTQCYESLPDYDHRSFLLYLSIFPRDHQIKSKSLVRRLIAEGLVVKEGCKCFDELIDRCIIEPVPIINNSVVAKSCQVHGIVLEYIIHKSVEKNVVTLIKGDEPLLKNSAETCVRRLSIQSSTKERFDELADKSALRSLIMFKSEPFDLRSCKMLRVLDLEGCTVDLDKRFLEGLCQLLLLRYLSLRRTGINKLPTQIEKLQRLETLDIRETKVEKLPMQVIMLPKLVYLFGRFQLPDVPNGKVTSTLSEFLKKKSVLHTLAGFVANKRQGPEHVILLARNLKKVKVWCNDDARNSFPCPDHGASNSSRRKRDCWGNTKEDKLRSMIADQECQSNNFDFIRLLKMRFTSLESVSIVSSGLCKDFFCSLEGPCNISSIKLRGNLDSLPNSNKLGELGRIKKLHLFSTGLTIKVLSALQYLRGLEYLKLVEHSDIFCSGIFIVEKNGFESLKSLWIEAPMPPKMQFNEGAMESLTSLHLLCPHSQMQQPSEIIEGISHLANLNEVIVHRSMQQAWETLANGHPNRPCVKRQPEPAAKTAA